MELSSVSKKVEAAKLMHHAGYSIITDSKLANEGYLAFISVLSSSLSPFSVTITNNAMFRALSYGLFLFLKNIRKKN